MLFALKKHLRASYRELVDDIKVMDKVRKFIELNKAPHYTTVQKAFARMKRIAQIFLIHVREYINYKERINIFCFYFVYVL